MAPVTFTNQSSQLVLNEFGESVVNERCRQQEHLRDPADGTTYVARVYGRARADGTWEGWIEFVAVGAAVVLRTDQETTQSNREGVAYWASGLGTAYLQGAFA